MKNKKKFTIPFATLACFSLLSGCGNKKIDIEYIENRTFDYGETLSACDLVTAINGKEIKDSDRQDGKIIHKNKEIVCDSLDTTTLGENIAYLSYNNQSYSVTYEVIDNESPKIFSDSDIYLDDGNNLNIEDYIKVTDNQNVTYSIEGEVDTSVSGIYEVIISAIDDSGNISQKGVKIHVGNDTTNRSSTLDEDNKQREEAAKKAADKLIEQLAELEKQKEQIEEENKGNISQEEVDEANENQKQNVLTPNCQKGEYELEASDSKDAINQAYEKYDCLSVQATPIQEEVIDEEGNVVQNKRYSIVCGCPVGLNK